MTPEQEERMQENFRGPLEWCEECGDLTNHTTKQHQEAAAEGRQEP